MALQERKKQAKSDPLLIKTKAFSRQSLCQSLISLLIVVVPLFVSSKSIFILWICRVAMNIPKKTRRIHFNNRIMNTLMLSVDNSNFQNDARETRMKGLKIVDEHRLLDQEMGRVSMATRWICSKISVERFCWPIQENWRYSSSYIRRTSAVKTHHFIYGLQPQRF